MTTYVSLPDKGVPKRTLIDLAYEDCGLAGYEFERTADEVQSALRKLNALMAEWPWSGLGYVLPHHGEGDAAEPSGVDPAFSQAVAMQLALRLASAMGKSLSPEQRAAMSRSRHLAMSSLAGIPAVALQPGTPRGQGNRRRSALFGPIL